jgi:KDO2-lipid IV(A) lauroyltransferase
MDAAIGNLPRELRRAATLGAMRGVLVTTRRLPPRATMALGAALGTGAGMILPLRARLLRNLTLGLRPACVPDGAARSFFRNLGRWFGWSMAIYHRGFWNSGVPDQIGFHESVVHLDEAVARGRGVILASPHQFCHEIGAAYINGRHEVVAVVRETANPRREAMKERWYQATGMEIVRRPRRSSIVADTFACLRVLKRGRLLGITPDVIVPPAAGVRVRMFGREVCLSPGMVVLAMRARAPLVTCYFRWERGGRLLLHFTEAVEYPAAGERERTAAEGLQAWCRQCEDNFRAHPGNWMFWLDKRWSRALREQPSPDGGPQGPPA